MSITDLRQRNIDDKAAGQCSGNLGVYVNGSRLIVDVAVPNEAVPGVADTERTSAESDLGAQLPGEHQVAEGGKQQTGVVTVVPVAKEEGLYDCLGPTRGPGSGPDGQLLQNGHHVAGRD